MKSGMEVGPEPPLTLALIPQGGEGDPRRRVRRGLVRLVGVGWSDASGRLALSRFGNRRYGRFGNLRYGRNGTGRRDAALHGRPEARRYARARDSGFVFKVSSWEERPISGIFELFVVKPLFSHSGHSGTRRNSLIRNHAQHFGEIDALMQAVTGYLDKRLKLDRTSAA